MSIDAWSFVYTSRGGSLAIDNLSGRRIVVQRAFVIPEEWSSSLLPLRLPVTSEPDSSLELIIIKHSMNAPEWLVLEWNYEGQEELRITERAV